MGGAGKPRGQGATAVAWRRDSQAWWKAVVMAGRKRRPPRAPSVAGARLSEVREDRQRTWAMKPRPHA